jgi:hypothetical protein
LSALTHTTSQQPIGERKVFRLACAATSRQLARFFSNYYVSRCVVLHNFGFCLHYNAPHNQFGEISDERHCMERQLVAFECGY